MAEVGSRYARAFADVIFEKKLDAVNAAEELRSLEKLLEDNLQLRRLWENPAVPAEQKRAVLDAIVRKSGLSKPLRNFVAVLLDRRRIGQLSSILRQYEEEVNRRLGLAEADITSFRELSAAEKKQLEAKIAAVTGKQVRAQYRTDSHILGGAIVRVGSTVYDGSVRGQLHKLKEQLTSS
jgi:F-type H+-transporting ATPase subunit delta